MMYEDLSLIQKQVRGMIWNDIIREGNYILEDMTGEDWKKRDEIQQKFVVAIYTKNQPMLGEDWEHLSDVEGFKDIHEQEIHKCHNCPYNCSSLPLREAEECCRQCEKGAIIKKYLMHGYEPNPELSDFYNAIYELIRRADRLSTRKARLRQLREVYPVLVEGYLLVDYGMTYDERFNGDCFDED